MNNKNKLQFKSLFTTVSSNAYTTTIDIAKTVLSKAIQIKSSSKVNIFLTYILFVSFIVSPRVFAASYERISCDSVYLNLTTQAGNGYNVYVSGPRGDDGTNGHENVLIIHLRNQSGEYHCKDGEQELRYAVLPIDRPEFSGILSMVLSAKASNKSLRVMLHKNKGGGTTREIMWVNY